MSLPGQEAFVLLARGCLHLHSERVGMLRRALRVLACTSVATARVFGRTVAVHGAIDNGDRLNIGTFKVSVSQRCAAKVQS